MMRTLALAATRTILLVIFLRFCPSAARMKVGNLICLSSREAATASGRRPRVVCNS